MGIQTQRNPQQSQDIVEIDVGNALRKLWKWKFLIVFGAVFGAALCFAYLWFCITPLYEASVTLYVNNSSSKEGSASITQSDLYASTQLVDTYAAIILSDAILEDVIRDVSLDMTIDELAELLEIKSVNDTEVFKVTVLYSEPETAARIVDSIAGIAPARITSIVKGSSVTVINYARVPEKIAYPNYVKNTLAGFAAGGILLVGCLILMDVMNTCVRASSDFSRWQYPLLVSIPDFMDKKQSGYYGMDTDNKRSIKRNKENRRKEEIRNDKKRSSGNICILNENTPFAVQEAYKTLRTNVIYSSPDQEKKIIILTSSQQGEAKTTTAINLAIAFAQNQSRVLLMDCDLRLPTIEKRLGIKRVPGLTDLMLGIETDENVLSELKNGLHVLPSGTIPPNPTEMLGSKKMEQILNQLTQNYDYIIMDTPPLETMPDAAILTKYATDIILVVRQNTTERAEIDGVIKKLELAKARILGFVFTCVTENERPSYGKNGYGYRYGYGRPDGEEGRSRKFKSGREGKYERY